VRLASLAALLVLAGSSPASERIPGPVPAELIRVVDGDTLLVSARIWPGQRVDTKVRLLGIDAPELRSPCAEEREQARAARDWLRRASEGRALLLRDVHYDKYGGRMLARVENDAGEDFGRALLKQGLARRYAGGQRATWC
jgi:endonuclease YncB( thermonuclease family)